jgi:hypothetical protein
MRVSLALIFLSFNPGIRIPKSKGVFFNKVGALYQRYRI